MPIFRMIPAGYSGISWSVPCLSRSILFPLAAVNKNPQTAMKPGSLRTLSGKAIAFSNDGLIEAVQSKDNMHKILGVQWHPELSHRVDSSEQRLFDFFVNEF